VRWNAAESAAPRWKSIRWRPAVPHNTAPNDAMRGIDEHAVWNDLALTKMAIAIDTLAYARRLRDAGFTE
jgi:hypothetical protein